MAYILIQLTLAITVNNYNKSEAGNKKLKY